MAMCRHGCSYDVNSLQYQNQFFGVCWFVEQFLINVDSNLEMR